MGPNLRARSKSVIGLGTRFDERRELTAPGGVRANHEINAPVLLERDIGASGGLFGSGVMPTRSIRPLAAEANDSIFFVEQKLHDNLVMQVIWDERMLEIRERRPASLVECKEGTEKRECIDYQFVKLFDGHTRGEAALWTRRCSF